MPASPMDAGRTATSVTAAGRVINSLTKKLPSGSGRAVMAMPGLPTEALGLWVGVGDLCRFCEIVRVGTMLGAGDMVEPAAGWREAGGGRVLAGTASVARTGPGRLSPAATATAAPSSAVTVKAP